MLRKDYLIKQFEEFGKVLSLILSHKKDQNYEAFEKEVSLAFKKYSHKDINQVESLSTEEFKKDILLNETLDFTQKKIIATLLFEKMNFYTETMQSETSERLKTKCLDLYQHIQDNTTENEFDLDVHYKLSFLKT